MILDRPVYLAGTKTGPLHVLEGAEGSDSVCGTKVAKSAARKIRVRADEEWPAELLEEVHGACRKKLK